MLWDPIRSLWVKKTPEEVVRQRLLQKMIAQLGYPKGLIAVERELKSGRRFDIVCFAKAKEELRPLLLVECKADKIEEAASRQAWGYNDTVGAPFLCLASDRSICTLWREEGKVKSIPFLPPFADLMRQVCF